jgi:alpha-mannosidase
MSRRALRAGAAAALCVLAMGVIGRERAVAQTPLQVAEIVKALDPDSQAVVGRLTELNRLPAEEWRFHAGDLAHGEATDLDDSSWPVVKSGATAPQDAVWFRRWIEVPQSLHGYDLTDATVWFHLGATANGPIPEIVYFNGRRVALGDDLEPIVLFDRAKPGDKALVAVKLLHTVDMKRFVGADLKIDFTANRPNPEDLRIEFLTAAALIPSLSKNATTDIGRAPGGIAAKYR